MAADDVFLPPGAGRAKRKESKAAVERDATALQESIWRLERRVEQQAAALQALFALLSRGEKPTEQAMINEVQRVTEQRREASAVACSRCGRPIAKQQAKCLYCGEPRPMASAFDVL